MDSCMWQTISKTDFLHPSHMWEHGTALRTWVCSKTQTLLDTLKTRNQPQEESCVFLETEHLSSPNVHETNCCLAQFYIVGDYFMDAGLRMVGLLALDLWDVVTEVLRSTSNTVQPKHTRIQEIGATLHFLAKTQVPKGGRSSNWMMWILYPQTFFSRCVSVVHFWGQRSSDQDDYQQDEAQRMRHMSRTHRVALDWLIVRINLEPKIQIKYVETKTNSLTLWSRKFLEMCMEWLCLFSNMNFSMYSCSHLKQPSFPTILIRLESRAPCRDEVRRRFRLKALQRRKRSHVWSLAGKGVRKSHHEVWDLWSSWWIPMKRKEVEIAAQKKSWCDPTQDQKSDILTRVDKRMIQSHPGNWCVRSNAKHTVMRAKHTAMKEHSNSKSSRKLAAPSPELKNMEYTNYRNKGKIFECLEKLEMPATTIPCGNSYRPGKYLLSSKLHNLVTVRRRLWD